MRSSSVEKPGPGNHDPNLSRVSVYRSASACNFGKSVRKPLDENERTPGPAVYNNDSKMSVLHSGPKFSVGKAPYKDEAVGNINPESPGPGTYDPNISLVKSASAHFHVGRERRLGFEKHRLTPGPGYYNLRGKESGPRWPFTKEARIAFTDKNNEAKHGTHYDIPSKVVDPPTYMNVQPKLKFSSPTKTSLSTHFNSAIKTADKIY